MLPRFARDRVREADPRGHVELIQVRPKRLAPTIEVDAWDLSASQDHGSSADRAVTLFQYEHLAVLESLLGRPVSFNQTRRNVAVSGFNLEVARGSVLSVGDALLEPTGRCHPCARMEESLGSGGFAAMFGHGGWTARIIESGVIRRGDTVRLHIADT
ncbi:MAG: MOSC domain-containing protein [Myxococcota bacterium]